MGRGSYTASDWLKLRKSCNLTAQQPVEAIFNHNSASDSLLSKSVSCRFSFDPDEVSKSTPVIVGFDITASMGYLAKELATNSMHNIMSALLANKKIEYPQVLCAAIGDCKSDKFPLQVTQFESDIRVVKQLLNIYLEGGGGGNGGESYNLLWYFAAKHTVHDCYNKQHKKGYLFTIGNDFCHSGLSPAEIRRNFVSRSEYVISNEELIFEVRKKYNIFHIHIEDGSASDERIFAQWCHLLPGCCAIINVNDVAYLAELINAIVLITNGLSHNEALKLLDQTKAEKIARSVATIQPPQNKNRISF